MKHQGAFSIPRAEQLARTEEASRSKERAHKLFRGYDRRHDYDDTWSVLSIIEDIKKQLYGRIAA